MFDFCGKNVYLLNDPYLIGENGWLPFMIHVFMEQNIYLLIEDFALLTSSQSFGKWH